MIVKTFKVIDALALSVIQLNRFWYHELTLKHKT